MHRNLKTILGLALSSSVLWSCIPKKSKPDSKLNESAESKQGLDVNDVSFLFPFPSNEAENEMMIPITFKNAQGVSPMTPELFREILGRHDTKVDVEGKLSNLQSGSRFDGIGNLKGRFPKVAVDTPEAWRIVAMRYDPCAATPEHNLRRRGPRTAEEMANPALCPAQLRLTAQPVQKSIAAD